MMNADAIKMNDTATTGSGTAFGVDNDIEIDGSFGEGGGQIIRNAITLACLLQKKIKITKIRHNRPNPGLASQHLESILALGRISGVKGSSVRLAKGLTEFDFDGQRQTNEGKDAPNDKYLETEIDLKTAGSITLCIQCILPYLLSLSIPAKIKIFGGTHVMKAPNMDYMNYVFCPMMEKFLGINFLGLRMIRPGYFPRGGGIVEMELNPQKFMPFIITNRGKLVQKSAILNLPQHLDHQQFIPKMKTINPHEDEIVLRVGRGNSSSYASFEYFLKFENSFAGFFDLIPVARRGPGPTGADVMNSITKVEKEVQEFLDCQEAAVDSFMQDQLILYMTMSKIQQRGSLSKFTTIYPLSDHTTSAIHVAQIMTGHEFKVKVSGESSGIKSKWCEVSI